MARITVKACFCSIIILCNLTLSSQGSIAVDVGDLSNSLNELISPRSFGDHCSDSEVDLPWENLITPACRSFDPLVIRDRTTVLQNEIATCPVELDAAKESERSSPGNTAPDPLSRRAIWSAASEFWITQQSSVHQSMLSAEGVFKDFHQSIGDFAIRSIESIPWTQARESSVGSIKQLVPTVLISHRRTVIEPEIEASIDSITEKDGTGNQFENESLISLPGDAQDSYWQYYEDCDRWGVHFAALIIEAHDNLETHSPNEECDEEEELIVSVINPHVLIARMMASQNLSTWLYPSPLVEFQPSEFVDQWIELADCIAAETAHLGLVGIDGRSRLSSAGPIKVQSSILHSEFVGQIESLTAGMMNVLEGVFSLNDSRHQTQSPVIDGRIRTE